MTQLSPTALEAAAKAVYESKLIVKPRAPWDDGISTVTKTFCKQAGEAAITAYLAQAEKEGWVMVPKEPTLGMMSAAGKAVAAYIEKMAASGGVVEASDYALRAVIYRAMIAAAQSGGE